MSDKDILGEERPSEPGANRRGNWLPYGAFAALLFLVAGICVITPLGQSIVDGLLGRQRPTPTALAAPQIVVAPTDTATPTATDTPTPTSTDTPVPTATRTPRPTVTLTSSPTSTEECVCSGVDYVCPGQPTAYNSSQCGGTNTCECRDPNKTLVCPDGTNADFNPACGVGGTVCTCALWYCPVCAPPGCPCLFHCTEDGTLCAGP